MALKAAEGDRFKGNSGWASAIYFLLERYLLLRIPPSFFTSKEFNWVLLLYLNSFFTFQKTIMCVFKVFLENLFMKEPSRSCRF